ncbi:NAD(P)-dependent oxidoreductase [Knoellia sp. p5-6-4]|uniref:NAD-dependent epimerase/dehydratase family protein n=1 Tax=unclassified Knoellia TaxID=2618719 RepID=UPI0023DB2508|nr:NAD-dependent epimerase/dehydratase family protein [Knoellia sp. p5-6-4]MDF2146429.1 GDP-mannose 4,6-dehydratase [Knoellia sp. p5-6-4]
MTGRAFVTGPDGFIGRHLVNLLVREGWEVGACGRRAVDRDGVSASWAVDIGDGAGLGEAIAGFRPDVVFHLAAAVDTVSTTSVTELFRVNTMGTVALLEAVRLAGNVGRVVFASSAFAYGYIDQGSEHVREDTPLRPRTAYGASKAAAETIVRQWSEQTGTETVVARGFQVSGPGHTGAYALAEWAGMLASGADEVRVGRLDVIRDYLDVRDAAAGYFALATHGVPGRTYNLASGVPTSMGALLDGLLTAFGSEAAVVADPARMRAVDQPVFVADVRRIMADTGWAPRVGIDEMLRDLAATRSSATP